MALINKKVFVRYAVGGPVLHHERLVLAHYEGDEYAVVSPDGDVFLELLSPLNRDLLSIRVRPNNGRLPAGVTGATAYGLPRWDEAQIGSFRDEANQLIAAERASRGGAAVVPAVTEGAAGSTDVMEHKAGELRWVAAETMEGIQYGNVVAGVLTACSKGAKIVHTLGSGKQIFVECVDGADLHEFRQRPARCDFRVLPQVLNGLSVPEISLKEAAASSCEIDVKWTLPGPRTAKWCLNYLAVEGLGFEGHHERVRQVCRVDTSAWGIQEHFQVSMALRQLVLVDQLDCCNLLSAELQFRRLQTVEFSYAEKAREGESRSIGGKLSLEEQTSFGGVTRQFSTLMVCPSLLEHVKSETEREASLAKNLRKAREEREASRKAAAKKKPHGGGEENP